MTLFRTQATAFAVAAVVMSMQTAPAHAYSKTETQPASDAPLTQFDGLSAGDLVPQGATYRLGGDPQLTVYTEYRVRFRLLLGELNDPAGKKGVIVEFVASDEKVDGVRSGFDRLEGQSPSGEGLPPTRAVSVGSHKCLGRGDPFSSILDCAVGDVIVSFTSSMDAPANDAAAEATYARFAAFAATFPLDKIAEARAKSQ